MTLRFLIALAATTCLSAPLWADEQDDALARIEALTEAEIFGEFIVLATENAQGCRFLLNNADDTSEFRDAMVSRIFDLADIPDVLRVQSMPDLIEKINTVDGERLAELYFLDFVVDEKQRLFLLPDCVETSS